MFDLSIFHILIFFMTFVHTQGKNARDIFPVMTVPDTIRYWGYPVEEHCVTTEDGYILGMHRIPAKNGKTGSKSPVFLGHALTSSSSEFVFGPTNNSLGYILNDLGYDVWMGNTRGNTYSKNHTSLDPCPTCEDFWSFGWDESGKFDYKAEIDYMLEHTGSSDFYFVGHSMGCTQFFVFLSNYPEYNSKIRSAALMAPPAYMSHATSAIFDLAPAADLIDTLYHLLGLYEFAPHLDIITFLGHEICDDEHPILEELCLNFGFLLFGINLDQLNTTMNEIYLDHIPEGTSTKPLVHYAQLYLSKKFRAYDYGSPEDNEANYGSPSPPDYDLTSITAPVAVFYGDKDDLVDVRDIERLVNELPNCILSHKVDYEGWTHIDFAIAKDAYTLLYSYIIEIFDSH